MRYLGLLTALLLLNVNGAFAALPLSEDFTTTTFKDAGKTTASWSVDEEALILQWEKSQDQSSLAVTPTSSDISADTDSTYSIALGDGDLDLVAGVGHRQCNFSYLYSG